jgi:hypothetical protein
MLHPGETLESLFDGSLICHMASRDNANPLLTIDRGVAVAIERFATTRLAALEAKSSNIPFPLPGMNAAQMDGFLDLSHGMQNLNLLRKREARKS